MSEIQQPIIPPTQTNTRRFTTATIGLRKSDPGSSKTNRKPQSSTKRTKNTKLSNSAAGTIPQTKGTMFFQPSPTPRKLTGRVFYYREINKIEKKERANHLKEVKNKEFIRQIRSPYREDFVQLRANSVLSTRKQLEQEQRDWLRQRGKDNVLAQRAIEREFEKEKRHCKKDVLTKTHPIVHVLDVSHS
ncbi:hypothetical protein TRFO_34041 [Tritrichomonas foetus]|uniref:Uncharacterized protein n=1 Tax=Tritrichomonas foetus TaxID=1144522 RepID=A0A1J4JPT0_9EUKA|nr:hypothetical protein TRFO_34041 [Tritrichomonas foetus]|eukprot:OHS99533.1 hypothetical protein TRFO_34041 [Tritrichomonas foetus]